jgi:hypothetical protein
VPGPAFRPASDRLPRLRADLDLMPSPFPERPGLLIRDPYRFSDATLVVPPLLVRCLACFDGQQSGLDLRATLARLTGAVAVSEIADRLVEALAGAGMLDDERYAALRADKEREFAAATARAAAHAGGGYPEERTEVVRTLASYLDGHARATASASQAHAASDADTAGALIGIAAPHVSPDGGPHAYAAAYAALPADLAQRAPTFVILGTSHYGEPNRFGLTRKTFVTPLGDAVTDGALVSELERAAGPGVKMEDYCHAVEHSIEFQVVFLQHLYGPQVRILPILCGPFVPPSVSPLSGGRPEDSDGVARLLGALGEIAAREGPRLCWVLGVDMTHTGRRYGDDYAARADTGPLLTVAARDRDRIDRIAAADAAGFWELLHENRDDDLKWCGSSPIYTFLRAVPGARGQLLRYDQWNIDADSVVSFAAMAFR